MLGTTPGPAAKASVEGQSYLESHGVSGLLFSNHALHECDKRIVVLGMRTAGEFLDGVGNDSCGGVVPIGGGAIVPE